MAGLATGLGAIPVVLGERLAHRWFDGMVGFAAGAMLAISGNDIGAALDGERLSTLAVAAAGGMAVLSSDRCCLRRRAVCSRQGQ